MTSLFNIELTINMPGSDRHARQLLNFYFADMPADIDATAYKLCEAKEAIQARKFAGLALKRADVWPGQGGGLQIFALLSVSGEEAAFVKQVIAEYMDGFSDYLKAASSRYFSYAGFPPDIPLQPTDWNAEIR